jgi:hypothetical protein
LPELLNGLRLRAVQAGLVSTNGEAGQGVSPFGDGRPGVPLARDPFETTGPAQRPGRYDPDPFDPFREGN